MIIFITIIGISILSVILYSVNPQKGGKISKALKIKLSNSSNFDGKKFKNPVFTKMTPPKLETFKEFFKKGVNRKPTHAIASKKFDELEFESGSHSSEIQFSWFGHSSILLKIEGMNLLIDPVFSKRASMFSWMGPKQFDYDHQMSVEDLPEIDAILISHDHYDHLDYKVILSLRDKVKQFYVPLGVRVHLEKWGIPANHIFDLDWWDNVELNEKLNIVLTPARHFSGRGLKDRFSTLWGGWAILGKQKNVFFSGDSGYFNGFKEIGEQLGPFDLAFIECGQYNKDWEAVHMLPEQSSQAAKEVNAKIVVPIRWGKFKLSIHSWTEPVVLFLKNAKEYPYKTLTPKPNEIVCISNNILQNNWWME